MMKKLLIAMLALLPVVSQAEVTWRMDDYAYCGGDWKYAGCTAAGLFVEIGVWPVAWGHHVYVVYTHDDWQTWDVQEATWMANVPNPYGSEDEKWGVSIPVGYTSMGGVLKPVEYAIFVDTDWGETAWDSNNGWNYYFPGGGSDVIEAW